MTTSTTTEPETLPITTGPASRSTMVLLSGGLDSAAALAWILELRETSKIDGPISALFVSYGQKQVRPEHRAAVELTERWGVPLAQTTIDHPWPRNGDRYEGRNLALLNVAASMIEAPAGTLRTVVHGANLDDHHDFPDCRPAFFEAAERALTLSLDQPVQLLAPWATVSKARIAHACSRLLGARGADALSLSWSCYWPHAGHGAWEPCGKCTACVRRARALEIARVPAAAATRPAPPACGATSSDAPTLCTLQAGHGGFHSWEYDGGDR